MDVRVRLLGQPAIMVGATVHEPPPGRAAALLYYLAYRAAWVSRDELLYLFWPDATEARARASLRSLLSALRRSGLAPTLEVERSRVRWLVATDLSETPAPSGGALLEGFRIVGADEFEQWLDLERAALDDRRRAAVLREVADAATSGRPGDAVAALDHWLLAHPLDEDALHRLLTLAREAGRREEALDRYRSFETRLVRDLGLDPSERLQDAVAALRADRDQGEHALASDGAAVRGRSLASTARSTGFVGREAELAWLDLRLAGAEEGATCQIVGPGGIGKTRLASEAARALRGAFAGEVVQVALAAATAADEALAMLATAAGSDVRDATEPLHRAVRGLQGRRVLVVLDNCEQVTGLADALERLRREVPEVRWLLTSRERVALDGTHELALDGLPTASEDGEPSAAEVLFIDRVRRAGGDVDDVAEGEAVARLVGRLGGMPLALELAAPWTWLLSAQDLLRHLESGGELPAHPGAPVEARHASLERVFEASWERLDASLRSALTRLTVFVGGCDVRTADLVAGVRLDTLARLRDASMLDVLQSGRVTQHPLIERFVRDRAEQAFAVADDVRERHARHFLELLQSCEERGQAGDSVAFETLQVEHGNVEAAWAFALEQGWWDPLMYGGAVLGLSYVYAGRSERWGPLLRSALARVPDDHLAWAVLTAHEASLDQFASRFDDAYRRRLRAVEVARRHSAPFFLAWVLFLFSQSATATGRGDEALAALTEADALLASVGDVEVRVMVSEGLYRHLLTLPEREARYAVHDDLCRRSSSDRHATSSMRLRSLDLAESHGRYREAVALAETIAARARGTDTNMVDVPGELCHLAAVCIAAGDLDRARSAAEEAVERGRPFAGPASYVDHAWAVFLLAWTHALLGDEAAAREVLRSDDATFEPPHASVSMLEARWALGRRDASTARRHVASWANRLAGAPMMRSVHATHLRIAVLDAEVSLVAGASPAAAGTVVEVLGKASELGFLPLVLEALVVASGLVPSPLCHRLRELAARHAATAGPVRLRAELQAYGTRPRDLAGWEPVHTHVASTRAALEAVATGVRSLG